MMPTQIQQIEREIEHLEDIAAIAHGADLIAVRAEVRRKWLSIKPFVTAGQIRLKDAARNG